LRRRTAGAATIVSLSTIAIAMVPLGCGVQADSAAAEEDRPGQVEESLGPTTGTITLSAVQDTAVRASLPNSNFGNATVLDENRTLIQFSQSAMTAALGPNDYLVSASLDMALAVSPSRRIVRLEEAYRLTHSWTENGATFNCAIDSNTSNAVA